MSGRNKNRETSPLDPGETEAPTRLYRETPRPFSFDHTDEEGNPTDLKGISRADGRYVETQGDKAFGVYELVTSFTTVGDTVDMGDHHITNYMLTGMLPTVVKNMPENVPGGTEAELCMIEFPNEDKTDPSNRGVVLTVDGDGEELYEFKEEEAVDENGDPTMEIRIIIPGKKDKISKNARKLKIGPGSRVTCSVRGKTPLHASSDYTDTPTDSTYEERLTLAMRNALGEHILELKASAAPESE